MEDIRSGEKIVLILMNDTAYVWSSEDWLRIRSLRIVGNFIGNLAAQPRQDQFAGLPLALLKEETTLLLEKGYAVLKSLSISNQPREILQSKSNEVREALFSEQIEILKNKRKQEIESKIDIILEGKRAKRRCPSNPEESSSEFKEFILQEEISKIQPPKKTTLAVEICTSDPWLEDDNYKECSWAHPNNNQESLNYLVFRDMWEKGYYITPGGKFGGKFLAYPGDPVKFHAFFIIVCLEKEKQLRMNEIITYGRLGQSVRKTVILAYLNERNNVTYQSIQWAGF